MARYKTILTLFITFIGFCECFNTAELIRDLHTKIGELRSKYDRLYGGAIKKPMKEWEFELEDKLSYPRGDKYKLHEISKQWIKYYECCTNLLKKVLATGTLAAISITAYEGTVARIPCGVCSARLHEQPTWLYAPSPNNLTYGLIDAQETGVFADGILSIYQVRPEHSGVYMCQLGASYGQTVTLEVIDYHDNGGNYTVVKPRSSHGPYSKPPVSYKNLVVFSSWSLWSECSRCGRWGRRRRYGACHVKLANRRDKRAKNDTLTTTPKHGSHERVCQEGSKFLQAFPGGVGCRSRFLPKCLKNLLVVQNRPNEIMLAMCKTPCKDKAMLESDNNSAIINSLSLSPPPAPAREVIFAVRGQPAIIQCKGTTLRDMPVTWRVGESRVSERALDRESAGRVRVNARDHIVFAAVWDSDANLYSCWQNNILVGEIKLEVWSLKTSAAGRCLLVIATAGTFYILHIVRGRRHRRRI